MSGGLTHPDVSRGIREIEEATADLIRAASEEEPASLRDAVDRRGEAVRRLIPRLREIRDAGDPDARKAMAEAVDGLAEQSREAETALRRVTERMKSAVGCLSRDAKALRGYAAAPPEASALDRSG